MKILSENAIRYLRVVSSTKASQMAYFPTPIDFVEDQLLQIILSNWLAKTNITVGEVLEEMKEISNSTLNRRLKNLRKMGIICHMADEIDNRIKYIYPTNLCIEYFNSTCNSNSRMLIQ
jgi:predicted transcriptional regulator